MSLTSKKPSQSSSLTAEDWLQIAESELAKHGISAIKVEVLAKKLKVTKGSFYWHFSDRNDLFRQLLTRWRARSTSAIINRINSANLTPKGRLKELFLLPHRQTGRVNGAALELAIRNWSQNNSIVKKSLNDVDNYRLTFIAEIYEALEYDKPQAELMAARFYYTILGMSMIETEQTDEHVERIFETLL
ncbi:TetR/AcrR family transcriptional regulator [uncultured Psychrobacter sp.]|uniref:TetR/AcrR family transcriptional regulator n=1 Tax=uncultured Psychrobacter sp. TaxID=259303 RepID=UPI003459293F